ncbi:MAG: C-type lectin domain-containing protein [Kiritimatiellae bacterium]|jgi:hypothetical protein|nr:C-type lectin domain-containing protein [Kiritimatiellia bacterium]
MNKHDFKTSADTALQNFVATVNKLQSELDCPQETIGGETLTAVVISAEKKNEIRNSAVELEGRKYCLVNLVLDYETAVAVSNQIGGILAIIDSESEQTFIAETLLGCDEYSSAWIGERIGNNNALALNGSGKLENTLKKESRWFICELI